MPRPKESDKNYIYSQVKKHDGPMNVKISHIVDMSHHLGLTTAQVHKIIDKYDERKVTTKTVKKIGVAALFKKYTSLNLHGDYNPDFIHEFIESLSKSNIIFYNGKTSEFVSCTPITEEDISTMTERKAIEACANRLGNNTKIIQALKKLLTKMDYTLNPLIDDEKMIELILQNVSVDVFFSRDSSVEKEIISVIKEYVPDYDVSTNHTHDAPIFMEYIYSIPLDLPFIIKKSQIQINM